LQHGKNKPEDWAEFVAQILASQGQTIVKEGKAIETAEEQLTELTKQAKEFAVKHLPILRAMQIA
jgi:ABC-type Fe3+ transport system substrate-binding protein